MTTTADFHRGDQVIYLPDHAQGNHNHPDCLRGFVTSTNARFVFVRYFFPGTLVLRTVANSESTLACNLIHRRFAETSIINQLLSLMP